MLFMFLCLHIVVQVVSGAKLAPPENIHVEKGLLKWTSASQDRNITYTVQYRSFDNEMWTDVPGCAQTLFHFCNVTVTKAESPHGCVMLRVQAKRGELTSRPVKACSRQGDSCTPEFSVTARPGSLTVHLSRNHSMALEHGDHAKHRVYYGKEGESLQLKHKDGASSVLIHNLEQGQRYCVMVQYIYYNNAIGLGSCIQCIVIPVSENVPKDVIVAVGFVIFMVFLLPAAYILIFQHRRIKQWLRPPYQMSDVLIQPFPEHHILWSSSSPNEERYDVISSIITEGSRKE
ncbi:uncharacterized protein LOC113123328 [Mastacembelus armatus]|uniref:Interferon gamma receptor 2 n=1 Tax=Mastacembelus armatus TaxID=205130 RepID=A0A3Q3LB18_9TELE|nr:uncharacterized protein LOC113123328 [Mastacembelus armatus]